MPSPFIHTAIGYIGYEAWHGRQLGLDKESAGLRPLAVLILVSNFPDLDFIPGALLRDPVSFHHYATHSFIAALIFAGIGKCLAEIPYLLLAIVAFSHPCLDVLTWDRYGWYNAPHGIPLFWPFSHHETFPVLRVFSAPYIGPNLSQVLSGTNFKIIAFEGAISLMLVGMTYVAQLSRKRFISDESSINTPEKFH